MRRLADDMYTWRAVYRVTQQEAADLASVHVNTWSRWERERTWPDEDSYSTINYLISRPPPWWDRRDAEGPGR